MSDSFSSLQVWFTSFCCFLRIIEFDSGCGDVLLLGSCSQENTLKMHQGYKCVGENMLFKLMTIEHDITWIPTRWDAWKSDSLQEVSSSSLWWMLWVFWLCLVCDHGNLKESGPIIWDCFSNFLCFWYQKKTHFCSCYLWCILQLKTVPFGRKYD